MSNEDRANPSNDPPPSVRRLVDHIEAAIAADLADAAGEADLEDLALDALARIAEATGYTSPPSRGSTYGEALDETARDFDGLVEHVRRLAAEAASPLLHLDAVTGRVTKLADAPPYRGRGPLLAWVEADRVAAARALRDVLGGEVRAWPPLTSIEVDDERAVIAVFRRLDVGGSLRQVEAWSTDGNEYTGGPAQLWTFSEAQYNMAGPLGVQDPSPVLTGRELAARLADLAGVVRR